jgi:hypothetical protein
VAPETVHRPRQCRERLATIRPVIREGSLQQAQHGVLQKAPGGEHGKAAGLVDHIEIPVVVNQPPARRHGLLSPGGALPLEPIAGTEKPVAIEPTAIEQDFALLQARSP